MSKHTPPKLVIATYNKSKYTEFQHFFQQNGIETVAAFELGLADVVEGETSFSHNARLKAEAATLETGLPALGDDSGIEIADLDNFPGVITARFTKECGGYPQAMRHYSDKLQKSEFAARYVASLCLAWPNGDRGIVEETCEGMLTTAVGFDRTGFGYDPWFIPTGFAQTVSELTLEEKQRISHRGKALRAAIRLIDHDLRSVL